MTRLEIATALLKRARRFVPGELGAEIEMFIHIESIHDEEPPTNPATPIARKSSGAMKAVRDPAREPENPHFRRAVEELAKGQDDK